MNKLKEQFEDLQSREKFICIISFIFFIVMAFSSWVWSPMQDRNKKTNRQYNQATKDFNWIKDNKSKLQLIVNKKNDSDVKDISSILNNAAISSQIAMKRLQPKGDGVSQIWFEDVEYDKLLDWIKIVEYDKGMVIKKLNLNNNGKKNRVDVNVILSITGLDN
jgi:general secretion pathway protein M